MDDETADAKLYRGSLLGFVMAVATDGDEGELEERRPTVLRISRISETDAHGRLQVSSFYGISLMECVLAARNEAGLPFETLALSEPCGIVTRTYIQPQELTIAAASVCRRNQLQCAAQGRCVARLPE